MSIIRVSKNKKNPYFLMNNTGINDSRLSLKAKGLLCYLISKPDNWYINYHDLIKNNKNQIKSIRSAVNELISTGYIVRNQHRKNNGQFTYYDFTVYEIPLKPKFFKSKLLPYSHFGHADKGYAEKDTLLNTKRKNILTTATHINLPNFNSSAAAPSISDNPVQKTTTIELLDILGIKNKKKIFDTFKLIDIFNYSTWLINSKKNILNPTGFLITALKEKWLDIELSEDKPGLRVFFCECSECHKHFAYEHYNPIHTLCLKCRKSIT